MRIHLICFFLLINTPLAGQTMSKKTETNRQGIARRKQRMYYNVGSFNYGLAPAILTKPGNGCCGSNEL